MEKFTYRTNKDNSDYLSISRSELCINVLRLQENNEELFNEANEIHEAMWKSGDTIFLNNDINIRKDSTIGKYIIENNYDLENYISFDRIVNAMNIAIFEDNAKITNKLARLFKERVAGDKKELEQLTKPEIIDYIIAHDNLKEYLEKHDGTYKEKEYYVYENGQISLKKLNPDTKVKVKTVL